MTDLAASSAEGPTIRERRSHCKVVHVTTGHHVYDTRIWKKECRSLARAGYNVTLIAPNDEDELVTDEVRILGITPPATRRERIIQTPIRAYKKVRGEEADVVHFHDIEFLPYAILLRLEGYSVLQDVHENTMESILGRESIPVAARKPVGMCLGALEKITGYLASGVIPATLSIAQKFKNISGPVQIVQNYPILDALDVSACSTPYTDRPPSVAYVGAITAIRGIRELIEAVQRVAEKRDVSLVLAGSFSSQSVEEKMRAQKGWGTVDFRGWVQYDDVARILSNTKAGIVTFHPEPNHIEAQPQKLFEYMAAGLPVIASDFPLWRDIVGTHDCGRLVDPQNPTEIAEAIAWILNHPSEAEAMGKRGREAVEKTFRWSEEELKLTSLYDTLFT